MSDIRTSEIRTSDIRTKFRLVFQTERSDFGHLLYFDTRFFQVRFFIHSPSRSDISMDMPPEEVVKREDIGWMNKVAFAQTTSTQ